jgi:hypothetical protein
VDPVRGWTPTQLARLFLVTVRRSHRADSGTVHEAMHREDCSRCIEGARDCGMGSVVAIIRNVPIATPGAPTTRRF